MSAPAGDGVDVDPGALTAHAAAVDGIADGVETARAAAAHVRLGRDAYGQLCQLVPALVDPLQEDGVDALAVARDALQDTADALRATARRYAETDQSAAGRFTSGPSS